MVRVRSQREEEYSTDCETPRQPRLRTSSGSYMTKKFDEPLSTVRTEDYHTLPTPKSTARSGASRLPRSTGRESGKRIESDMESVQTEDYLHEYEKTMVPVKERKSRCDEQPERRSYREYRRLSDEKRAPQAQKPPQAPRKYRDVLKVYQKRGYDGASELETARTEDFDRGSHVAGVNLECFDDVLIESDVDTVKSLEVRNKFRTAMAQSNNYASEMSEDDHMERIYENGNHAVRAETPSRRETVTYQFYDKDDDVTSVDEDVKHCTMEIQRESRRIVKEMEDERRKYVRHQQQQQARVSRSIERPAKANKAKNGEDHATNGRTAHSLERLSRTHTKTPEDKADPQLEKSVLAKEIKDKLGDLKVLADTVEEAKSEKRVLITELRGLRDTFQDRQNEIKVSTLHARNYKSKADELKSELALLEYKRAQTHQQLEDTEKALETKRQRMEELDGHIQANLDRLKDFEELGMTADQVKGIMSEKDKLESQVDKQEAVEQERDLLKEKLVQTKEELYEADKRNRAKITALEEKLDGLVKQAEDLQTDKAYLQQQLRLVEDTHAKEMNEKDHLMEQKEEEFGAVHKNLQDELENAKNDAVNEANRLKLEIEGLQGRTTSMQDELDEKIDDNTKLKDQILDLQCDLSREVELREQEGESYKDQITKLEVEKDASNTEIRQQLYNSKQAELQEAYDLFEQERRQLAKKHESRLSEQLANHHQELMVRDEENLMLREQVHNLEEKLRSSDDRAHAEAKNYFNEELENERERWEAERDRAWKEELAKVTEESAKAIKQVRDDLDREKNICQHLERQIDIFKQDLEEQRQANRLAYKEKLDSIGRIKEDAQEERNNAVERARQRALDEGNREIERLKLELATKEEEMKRLRCEAEHVHQREHENQSLAAKHDKTIIHEINDDCKKTALLLGVKPRRVAGSTRQRESSPTRSAVHAALANLRACNEQLRGYVVEIEKEIDNQRAVMVNMQKEKEQSLCAQKERLFKEKTDEMDTLKNRLIKDHMEELVRLQEQSPDKAMKQALIDKDAELRVIQRNMTTWKEEVAVKFAKKFEEELNREVERRTRDLKRMLREKDRALAQQQHQRDMPKRWVLE